jgi:hypothetical protein
VNACEWEPTKASNRDDHFRIRTTRWYNARCGSCTLGNHDKNPLTPRKLFNWTVLFIFDFKSLHCPTSAKKMEYGGTNRSVVVRSPIISTLPNLPDAPSSQSSAYVSPAVRTPISHRLAEAHVSTPPTATVVSPSRIASPTRAESDPLTESASLRSKNKVVSFPLGAASPRG